MYIKGMDVPVTELRAHLSDWLDRVRGGEEVIVTDRGVPVARLLGMSATATLQRLAADGVIGRDVSARRPAATGRTRPRPLRPVSDIISDHRGGPRGPRLFRLKRASETGARRTGDPASSRTVGCVRRRAF